jgi:hypothetical protein
MSFPSLPSLVGRSGRRSSNRCARHKWVPVSTSDAWFIIICYLHVISMVVAVVSSASLSAGVVLQITETHNISHHAQSCRRWTDFMRYAHHTRATPAHATPRQARTSAATSEPTVTHTYLLEYRQCKYYLSHAITRIAVSHRSSGHTPQLAVCLFDTCRVP